MNWSISTWSLKTRRSSILKYGSESDKGNISSEVNGRNRPRGKISRNRKLMYKPLYPKRQGVYVASKANDDQSISSPPLPSPLLQPSPPKPKQKLRKKTQPKKTRPIRHQLLISPPSNPKPKKKPRTKKPSAGKNITRSKRKASEVVLNQVDTAFATAFPSSKSPHHNFSCAHCHLSNHMFYKKASEKCGIESCSLELHHICMLEYGTKTYGEESESIGMRKFCESCFTKAAKKKKMKNWIEAIV